MLCHCKIFRHGAWAEPVPSPPRLATTGSVGFTEGSSNNEVAESASLTLCVLSDLAGNSMRWRKCRQNAVYHSRWAKENGKYRRTELHSEMELPQAHLLQ